MSVVLLAYRQGRSLKGAKCSPSMYPCSRPTSSLSLHYPSSWPSVSPDFRLALALTSTSVSLDLHCGASSTLISSLLLLIFLEITWCPSSDSAPFHLPSLTVKVCFFLLFYMIIWISTFQQVLIWKYICSITILNWNTLVMILCSAFFFFLQIMCVHMYVWKYVCVFYSSSLQP